MENISEIVSHFNFTQTRKSRQYLNLFFSQKSFNKNQTLYTQQKLKMFLENLHVIKDYRFSENAVSVIHKLLGEADSYNYTFIRNLTYRNFFKEINNNLSIFIEFFHGFHAVLENFKQSEFCKDYCAEINETLKFIKSLTVIDYHQKELNFKLRKTLLLTIKSEIGKKSFESFWDFFYMFDVHSSIAKGIALNDLVFPEFSDNQTFIIREFYHLDLTKSVKNTLTEREKNIMVFTGANMSGKSTAMKSVSIIVLLAHLGIAVPAKSCKIPFYDRIFLHFSVTDNLKEGHSHFMQEIINIKNVLVELKTKNCFAVFDEIFSGTNINDSAKITVDTILGISKYTNSMFIFSTHLNMIENLLKDRKNITLLNLECLFENNDLLFTYRLQKGWSKLEVGKIIFDQYGLNDLLKDDHQC
ncbi:MutS-related protein [Chryseobacterium wangxinyae]|uniref:MutS-related protein n=1 Tax=Chryseobacterium sp. CY353 TaxID=2997334 RepID=UPI002271BD6B|nr:hypothetical protein [Chryseobacterium sp. CY353]MCY0968340.1 hypothetical protein [Chryseobacterium sp. CY353]